MAAGARPRFWRGVFEVEVVGGGEALDDDGVLELLQQAAGGRAFGVRTVRTRSISRRRAAETLATRGEDPKAVVTDWGRRKTDRFEEWTCPDCEQVVAGRRALHIAYCPGPKTAGGEVAAEA